MTLWFVFALMTGAAILAVLLPLARGRAAAIAGQGSDLAVYRDQLAEIDRDRDSGFIGKTEAEAARIEVSRRLIAASEAHSDPVVSGANARRRTAAIVAFLVVPGVAAALYGWRGQPDYAGQPLAARTREAPARNDLDALVARVEAHLAANPEDGRGWEVVAPVYLRAGRPADAVKARANALRLLGPTADRHADLAEALVSEAQGVVTAAAKAAFEQAVASEADHPKARYFLGLAADQDGKRDDARRIWERIVEVGPPNAPWLPLIRSELERIGFAQAPAPALPTADAIRGMVDSLAAKLASDGSDFDGWLRLVRSYAVLGDGDKARQAAADARSRFSADADKVGQLDALIRELGLGG
ncbi:c-type cytochrome biogenesis protein CcmI [Phreatobacter aquaticus]|uniref:C-type cytochrome biogenesis protein CcmI n=1 Tax=Phreatobacter aquaticus TaxID=2570229 RepID=A0A4D7QLX7_9HYPH|nr:c-type cytochrome biogenesis protein CcmI [Phreatobacter aquaticus]QCK86649.1 c-type cytochrome biogenesis protein CcmI [Phreatobacter aquaticus]